MKIMERLFRFFRRRNRAGQDEGHSLDFGENLLNSDGQFRKFDDSAIPTSPNAIDPMGDGLASLEAHKGKHSVCDLLFDPGEDLRETNHDQGKAARVVLTEDHYIGEKSLSSLITNSQEPETAETCEESGKSEIVLVGQAAPIIALTPWTEERVELLKRMWSEGDSAGQIAKALGVTRNAVLGKARRLGVWTRVSAETPYPGNESDNATLGTPSTSFASSTSVIVSDTQKSGIGGARPEPDVLDDDIDNLLNFEAEEEPEDHFSRSGNETASGAFIPHVSSAPEVSDDEQGDWDLDLTPAKIVGDGITTANAANSDHDAEHDFLRVRNRGPRSVKRTVIQTGTRLSIDSDICIAWAEEILAKGWCSFDDVEGLVVLCEGNGDLEELCINLQRNLEALGLDLVDQETVCDVGLWDAISDISSDDLAEAVEAALTRSTRLPGTQRFFLDKANELQLLGPMVRAKQELQLGILASEVTVKMLLGIVDSICDGTRDPGSVSLRTIILSRPGHAETAEVLAAAETLRSWQSNGRVMDGKQRREALAALEELDLTLTLYNELVSSLEQDNVSVEQSSKLADLISVFEAATENLIREHLPYARRFAARNTEEGEDPEDVFQVAYMGLQRSVRRFDPERGVRFAVYCSFWMKQALTRWRADEGALIRIPVHRHENLAKLDGAQDKLDVRADDSVSDNDLAAELGWTVHEVRMFRKIPRQAVYPETIKCWDDLLSEPEGADAVDKAETENIIADALAELPERLADVIRMRFGIGFDGERTLEEIGQLYGVTRERIRQMEAKGLAYLSHRGRKRRLKKLLGR